jgi:hypothetical protein
VDRTDVIFMEVAIAFVLVAGTCVGTFWLWLRARARRPANLDKTIESLREENAQLQAELMTRMNELEERLDFTERRLVQGREAKARTPV